MGFFANTLLQPFPNCLVARRYFLFLQSRIVYLLYRLLQNSSQSGNSCIYSNEVTFFLLSFRNLFLVIIVYFLRNNRGCSLWVVLVCAESYSETYFRMREFISCSIFGSDIAVNSQSLLACFLSPSLRCIKPRR